MNSILKAYKYGVKNNLLTSGKNWYAEAHAFAKELSFKHQINLDKVCAVIAALSPSVEWEINKRDARELCTAYELNLHNEIFRHYNCATYGKNVLKAIDILNSTDKDIESFFVAKYHGFKTHSFYLNILNPYKHTRVTIDRHAIAIAIGFNNSYAEKLSAKKYTQFESEYVKTANKLKILPHELQAVVWVAYKHAKDNNYKIY